MLQVSKGVGSMIAGYVRVSTQKQVDDGVSIEMQQQLILKHAKMLELVKSGEEIKFYIDDGYSGSSLERPQMKKLINDIKKGRINLLMAYDLSRVSRDMFDSNTFLNMANKYNVVIKCLYDDVSFTTANNRFSTNIKILTNQYEREKIVERTNDSLQSIADSGRYPCGGKATFGYYRGNDKNLHIYEKQAKVVRKIFEMAVEGYVIKDIVVYINTATNDIRAYEDTVTRIIRNTRYKGELNFKGKIYTNLVPAIVDPETFEQANFNFKRWQAKKNKKYVFDGVAICSKCGSIMRCTMGNNHQGKKYFYYTCNHCKKSISQNILEKSFVELDSKGSKLMKIRKSILQKRRDTNKKIARIKDKYFNDVITDDEYYYLATELEKHLLELNERLKLYKNYKYDIKWDIRQKSNYIRKQVREIVIDIDKKVIKGITYIK